MPGLPCTAPLLLASYRYVICKQCVPYGEGFVQGVPPPSGDRIARAKPLWPLSGTVAALAMKVRNSSLCCIAGMYQPFACRGLPWLRL